MFRQLVRLIVQILLWIIPVIVRVVVIMFSLALTAITSIAVGVPRTIERISDHWSREASSSGVSLAYHPVLRNGARIAATISLILGWLVLASLTVFIIRLIL